MIAYTIGAERNPVFVTKRQEARDAAENRWRAATHRAPIELTGVELESAMVRCTFADLAEQAFRDWLAFDLMTRFPDPTTKIRIEVGP